MGLRSINNEKASFQDTYANTGSDAAYPIVPPQLTFRYHIWADDYQPLRVYWEDSADSSMTQIWYKDEKTHTSSTDEWDLAKCDISQFLGETGRFFLTILVEDDAGSTNDPAFCDFKVNSEYIAGFTLPTTTTIATDTSSWRTHSLNDAHNGNSASGTANLSTTMAMPDNATSRTWNIYAGATPSNNTGPDKHYDNDDSSTYLYYEASGGSTNIWRGFKVRMNSTVTLPSS